MHITEVEIALFLQQYFFPFLRIGAMLMVMPVIGSRLVSTKVRLALAALTSIVVVPMLPAIDHSPLLSLSILIKIIQEILIGVAMGFFFQVVFQVFVLTGQIMAMKMGLGFASMNDPANGVQTTVLSQFFLMLSTITFVSLNGHLMMISMIVESYQTMAPGQMTLSPNKLFELAGVGSWMFATALVFALPIITSLLFINMAFGVMSRAAPQLNIFAVGFPFTLVCGMLMVWIGMSNYSDYFEKVMDEGFAFAHFLLDGK